jgi:hypothetical protein
MSSNTVIFVSEDRTSTTYLNLYNNYGVESSVLYPRSIATRWEYNTIYYNKTDTILSCDNAIIYIGEMFGKIWKVNVNICLDKINQNR